MPATRKEPVVTAGTDPWMTVPEAARALGVANATVLQIALRGDLETMTVAKRTYVKRASVEALKARSAPVEG
jgi:predicted transcriptional regulator